MTKLVRGVQIIDFGFLTELVAANTHPTGLFQCDAEGTA